MAIKALFFDIDGTLVSFRTHRIPQSTVDALTQARARGVGIYISTGRPMGFINNLGQISHLIDGWITTSGALCHIGGRVVRQLTFRDDDARRIMDYCHAHHIPSVVVGTTRIGAVEMQPVLQEVFGRGLGLGDFQFAPISEVLAEPLLQMSPFLTPEQEAELMPQLAEVHSGRWTSTFTDLTRTGADKGAALADMAAHIGVGMDETMAFGDGGNDLSIIRHAGIGVAMGNATDDVKRAADHVTAAVDDDGVALALRHFGVI